MWYQSGDPRTATLTVHDIAAKYESVAACTDVGGSIVNTIALSLRRIVSRSRGTIDKGIRSAPSESHRTSLCASDSATINQGSKNHLLK